VPGRVITSEAQVAVAKCPPSGFAGAINFGGIGSKHPQTRAGIGDDPRKRLVDFVGD